MNPKEEAIKWFKGTITGENLYSEGNEGYKDFEVALEIATRKAKKEVFDNIEKFVLKEDGFQNIYLLKQLNIDAMKKHHLPNLPHGIP